MKRLARRFFFVKSSLVLTNAISNQALAGGQIHCGAKNELRQQETGISVDAVTA
jgi:hypothetical protein